MARTKEAIGLLVAAGAPLEERNEGGWTPLHMACVFSRLFTTTVEELVSKGARVDARDKGGMTPLHIACEVGVVSDVGILLSAGAPISSVDENGRLPLHMAVTAEENRGEIVRTLEEERERRSAVWRAAKLKWRCWAVAVREELDVEAFIPPVIIRQSRAWAARHPWIALEPHFDFY